MTDLKDEIKELADIANLVPEGFKEICFRLLLEDLLNSRKNNLKGKANKADDINNSQNFTEDQRVKSDTQSDGDINQSIVHLKAKKFFERYALSVCRTLCKSGVMYS